MNLVLSVSPVVAAIIIIAAFGFALWSYLGTQPPVSGIRRSILIALRTIGIALLLFALFEPILSFLKTTAEQPQIIVAVDNSASMTLGGQDSSRIKEAGAIVSGIAKSQVAAQTRFTVFDDSTRPLIKTIPLSALNAHGSGTCIEAPFLLMADSLRTANIRAFVLISDGRYNAGTNPVFDAEKLGVPVYTIGLGDSVEPRDLSIQQVFTNEITYVGTELPVEVRVKSAGYESGTATVELHDEGGVIGHQQLVLRPGTNEYTINFTYKATKEGIAKLQSTVTGGTGQELTAKNNTRSAFVKVKSNKRRYILIAGSPNPDVAFIKHHLESEKDVEVKSYVQKVGGDFIEGTLDAGTFRDAEAVVLIGYPTSQTTESTLRTIQSAITGADIPVMFVSSADCDIGKLRTLENLLPVTFSAARGNEMQAFATLTESAKSSAILRGTNTDAWSALPPIFRTETSARAKPESEVLAKVRIGATALDEPLIVSRRLGRSRSVAVLGYGLYRWQLLGDALHASHGEKPAGVLETFIGSSLRWLASRDEQKQVRIVTDKQIYNLGDPVRFVGQVYDESYNPLSDAEVLVSITGARDQRITLSPLGSGRYEGLLTNLPPGDYSFTGTARDNGRNIGSDAGRFTIGETGIEFLQPSMNAEFMRTLASRTGGKFYTARKSSELVRDILADKKFAPRSLESKTESALWNNIWLLMAALGCFAIEWFIRKRSGML